MKRDWLDEFGKAATGKLFEHSKINSKKRPISQDDDVIDLTENENDFNLEFKIVFPTLKTVETSLIGPSGFGTLFCKKKDFQAPNFPVELFYNCTSELGQCKYAMHSKIMTVSSSSSNDDSPEYIYCGSHNFTASAWGKTTKQGAMLMINNFEVGVIIPKPACNLIEYPYIRPPLKYDSNDLPWDQTDYFST